MKREGDSYRVGNFVYERRRELVVGLEHVWLETFRVCGIWDGVGPDSIFFFGRRYLGRS